MVFKAGRRNGFRAAVSAKATPGGVHRDVRGGAEFIS